MKKRILLIVMILLLTTGCTCEYNLTIDGNTYKEQVSILGENSDEISSFNNEWEIPIDKEEYNRPGDPSTDYEKNNTIYNYKVSGNKLTFNYDFNKNQLVNSTAVSNCYNKLTISNYNNEIIISTSSKADCFDNHPPLNNVKVTIKVDRDVISHDADNVNGNTYTWNITKENAKNKGINLILNNNQQEEGNNTSSSSTNQTTEKKKNDYTLYIFLIVILAIVFLGYKWFMKLKEKNNNID